MECLKSSNQLVNTLLFPGSLIKSTYDHHDFAGGQLIFIPIQARNCITTLPKYIPALLRLGNKKTAAVFCIHFHGNACDVGQISLCADREGYSFNAHYLIVEYPGYGVGLGFPNEESINIIAMSVYSFVENELQVPSSRIVLIGRSIGTGPACSVAAQLQKVGRQPAALVLQSPFSSIRYAASDLLGSVISSCMLDRWPNWKHLCGVGGDTTLAIQCPVLFIHADCDQIIDYHHSVSLHAARVKAGLISEFFTQESTPDFKKGHNYYDYDHDVIVPTRNFLAKHIFIGTGKNAILKLPGNALTKALEIPKEYGSRKLATKSKCGCSIILMWCVCPIVFTVEACCGCASNVCCNPQAISSCCFLVSDSSAKSFTYDSRKKRGNKLPGDEHLVFTGLRALAKSGNIQFSIEESEGKASRFEGAPTSVTAISNPLLGEPPLKTNNKGKDTPHHRPARSGNESMLNSSKSDTSVDNAVVLDDMSVVKENNQPSLIKKLTSTKLRRGSDGSISHKRLNTDEYSDLAEVKVSSSMSSEPGVHMHTLVKTGHAKVLGSSFDLMERSASGGGDQITGTLTHTPRKRSNSTNSANSLCKTNSVFELLPDRFSLDSSSDDCSEGRNSSNSAAGSVTNEPLSFETKMAEANNISLKYLQATETDKEDDIEDSEDQLPTLASPRHLHQDSPNIVHHDYVPG